METDPQTGQTGSLPTITQPHLAPPPMVQPMSQSVTQPPTLPPYPSALPYAQIPPGRQGPGRGAIACVAGIVLVMLVAMGIAAGTLPGAVVRARTIAYPKPSVGIAMPQNTGPIRVGDTITFVAQVRAGRDLIYNWDFGDETFATGAQVTHAYSQYSNGGYTVSLSVYDPIEQSAQAQIPVNVLPQQPVASFTAIPNPDNPFEVQFDATASQGTQLTCSWDFGDGNTDTGGNCQTYNDYQQLGSYTVRLTVVDIANQQASTSQTVAVTLPKPTASFTVTPDNFNTSCVNVDASASTGYQLSYSWDFGEGLGSSVGSSTNYYCYSSSGTFTITLVVTDQGGQTARATQSVTV